jgi:hypothetical protein
MRMLNLCRGRNGWMAAFLLAAACARAPAEREEWLAVEPALLDLGSVTKGERGNGVWRLQNTSAEALAISRIGPSGCQCASLELLLPDRAGQRRSITDGQLMDLELAPGERAEVHFTLDTARYREPISRKVGGIPVVLRDHPYVMLEWAADIWTPFAVSPWEVSLGEVGMREQPRGRVLVSAHDEADFDLVVDAVIDGWQVKSERLTPSDEKALYEIVVIAPAELPEGGFQKNFEFLTSLAGAPPVRFTVQGQARPDLTVSPTRVMLDPHSGRTSMRVELRNRALNGMVGDFQVEGLPAGLEAVEIDAQAAPRRGFTLRWADTAPAAVVKGILILRTSDPERPILELPYSILPARASGS